MSRHRLLPYKLVLVTAILLLLYVWTLQDSAPFRVDVSHGVCTAEFGARSSRIACPDIEGGRIGIYLTQTPPMTRFLERPLDFFVPSAAWEQVILLSAEGQKAPIELQVPSSRSSQIGRTGTLQSWPAPTSSDYQISASVRRPDNELAGIVFLQPQKNDGYIFLVDSENRQGSWWHWRDGKRAEGIGGVPYQKPLIAQLQSLLRQVLVTFSGALALIVVAAVLSHLSQWLTRTAFWQTRAGNLASHLHLHPALYLLPLMIALFGITIFIAIDRLQMVPHVQDSITFLFQAQTFAGRSLWAPAPVKPDAFVQEFLMVSGGKWFGQYPPGYPALLVPAVLIGAPWLANPWLVILVPALLYRLGTLLYRQRTGLLAAALALASPFFVILSGSMMVHTAELVWVLATMVGWTLALRAPYRIRWAVVTGISLGMLLLTRQITAVAIGLSYLPALWLLTVWTSARHEAGRFLLRQGALAVAAAVPFLLGQLAYQAALTGSPWDDPRLLGRPFDHPGFGEDVGERQNAFHLTAFEDGETVTWYTDPDQPPRGHDLARGLFNSEQNFEALTNQLFGWYPLFALAFCWLPFLLIRPSRYDWLLLLTGLTILAIYVLYWTTGIMYGPRYYFAALPALLLLTARGVQALAASTSKGGTAAVLALLLLGALLFYWPGALSNLEGYNFISGDDLALVEAEIDGRALVLVPGEAWWDYGRFFSGNTPWFDGPIIYARDLGEENNKSLQKAFPERAAYLWQPDSNNVKP